MIVYLDLFIIKNLIFNMLIIFLSGKFLKQKTNIKRYFLAALVGAAYAYLIILKRTEFLVSNFVKTLVMLVMILIAYLPQKIYSIIFACFIFTLLTACIGGFLIMINIQKIFIIQFSVSFFIGIIIYLCAKIYNQHQKYESYKCKITIRIDKKEMNLNAFIDTGNVLKDSLSGESVIFVTMKELEKNLPEKLIKILKSEVLEIDEKYYGKIKMIEYQTINKSMNVLVGIKADNVVVETEKCTIKNEKIIVAPTENKFKNCDALIGMNILEEGYVHGDTISFETKSEKIVEQNFNEYKYIGK